MDIPRVQDGGQVAAGTGPEFGKSGAGRMGRQIDGPVQAMSGTNPPRDIKTAFYFTIEPAYWSKSCAAFSRDSAHALALKIRTVPLLLFWLIICTSGFDQIHYCLFCRAVVGTELFRP